MQLNKTNSGNCNLKAACIYIFFNLVVLYWELTPLQKQNYK